MFIDLHQLDIRCTTQLQKAASLVVVQLEVGVPSMEPTPCRCGVAGQSSGSLRQLGSVEISLLSERSLRRITVAELRQA